MGEADGITLRELRVLDGPNLYFTRPAIKLTLGVGSWLGLPDERAKRLARRAGIPSVASAGVPGSDQRRRFIARLAVHLTRELADATQTHLAVRGRPGANTDEVVIAFPWRRQGAAEAFGRELAPVLELGLDGRRSIARAIEEAAGRVGAVEPGAPPPGLRPAIPVIAVTGTNGKTTTVRLIAHLARTAGQSVAYTTTDGVYRDDQLVEAGDYSGFSGAAKALAQPGIAVAVLETARGGILLRGIGTDHNDVAVVTNVTADHLDQYGIRTLDQLAEVKATITKITRPNGWDVLNADDPRVLAMRRQAAGHPWLFSLDADHPAIRATLAEGGRAISVLDGALVIDYAHNEDGLRGLLEICQGLRLRGARVFLSFGAAGDRTDVILHRLGYTAARGADRVAIAELRRYLRGRDPQDLIRRLQAGIIDGGKPQAPVFPDEVEALDWMLREAEAGDVVAITALSQRPEIFSYLRECGGVSADPQLVRSLVRRARE